MTDATPGATTGGAAGAPGAASPAAPARRAAAGAWAALALLVGLHVAAVWTYAVDVPYHDEWSYFAADALPAGLSPGWLWAQHNEHRIVWTKLEAWALLRAGGLDLAAMAALNAALLGGLAAALAGLAVRGGLAAPWACGAAALLLSPAGVQNHLWAFQSQFTLALLGLVVGAWGLLDDAPRAGRPAGAARRALGVAGLGLAVTSNALGVLGTAALALVVGARRATQGRAARAAGDAAGAARARRELLAGVGAALALVAVWSVGWERPGEGDPLWPTAWRFWDVLLNLVSFGAGVDTVSAALGALVAAALVAPPALAAGRGDARAWPALGLSLALVAALAGVALGRGAWGPAYAKTSRYATVAAPLVALGLVGWDRLLAARPAARPLALTLVLGGALAASRERLDLDAYRLVRASREAGLACLAAAARGERPPLCREVSPRSVGEELARARALGVSFTRRLPAPAGPTR